NRIVPGQVHLPRYLRPLCPGVSPTHLNRGEGRRPAAPGADVLHEGPVPAADAEELRRIRAEFITVIVNFLLLALASVFHRG
ncbi:MAG TPA: hypothetical protein VGD43_05310, partial [Micromonospora sp.]